MKVGQFEQVPFESGGRKVSDLKVSQAIPKWNWILILDP